MAEPAQGALKPSHDGRRRWRPQWTAKMALIPAMTITIVCFYGFIIWTFVISLTRSRLLPVYKFTGFDQYIRLFANERWWTAMQNLAIHGCLFIGGCVVFGYLLAILIDRGIKAEGMFRTIFMLPLSMSFIVTGVIWQWVMNPGLGLQDAVRELGWTTFEFNGVWQQVGLCMALFLAGLRNIDPNIWKASRVDGIPVWRVYFHIITPMMRTVFFTVFILMSAIVMKAFDLVVALTGGGPGFSSDLPARFVVDHILNRQELGLGAAGAFVLLCTVIAVISPYIHFELRKERGGRGH